METDEGCYNTFKALRKTEVTLDLTYTLPKKQLAYGRPTKTFLEVVYLTASKKGDLEVLQDIADLIREDVIQVDQHPSLIKDIFKEEKSELSEKWRQALQNKSFTYQIEHLNFFLFPGSADEKRVRTMPSIYPNCEFTPSHTTDIFGTVQVPSLSRLLYTYLTELEKQGIKPKLSRFFNMALIQSANWDADRRQLSELSYFKPENNPLPTKRLSQII